MTIDVNKKYMLTGGQIEDLASRLALTGGEVADKAEKAQTGSTAPTTSTPGEIGQLYIQSDGTVYILKSIIEESGQPDEYTWEEVGAGGSGGSTITELTSADYNYPTDNPTGVALWLLEPGVYYRTTTSVRVYLDSSAGGMANDYRTFAVSPVTGTESKMIYMFSTTGSTTYRARINSGTGAVLLSSTAILDGNTISQSTGTSTTLVMSQKAVTDALATAGAAEINSTDWSALWQ